MTTVHRGRRGLNWLLNALGEPTRRRVYEVVRQARRPVTRADVAEAMGIGVRLAAFHLDKLVDQRLLTAHYARQPGRRSGPGAGRTAKWYTLGPDVFDISVPPRRHDIAAQILLRTVHGSGRAVQKTLIAQARECGREVGRHAARPALEPLLTTLGYEPRVSADRTIELMNCPFQELVTEAQETVCSMNLALLNGLMETVDNRHLAVLEPRDDYCCVRLAYRPGHAEAAPRKPSV
jgi:predicted ArsR family transcriptional regulator